MNELEYQKAIRCDSEIESKSRKKEIKNVYEHTKTVLQRNSKKAEKVSKARNGKDALLRKGQWMYMNNLRKLKEALDMEGWARMNSLKVRIEINGLENFKEVKCFSCLFYLPINNEDAN